MFKIKFTRKNWLAQWLAGLTLAGTLFPAFAGAQCLTASFGQYPSGTQAINCTGSPQTLVSNGWAGEYTMVTVNSGTAYTFTSSVGTDFITIGTSDGATALASGVTPLVWTPTVTGNVRFYTHSNAACGEETVSRTRAVNCAAPPCPPPYSVSAGSLTSSGATINWSGTGNFILEYGPAGFLPGTGATAGGGTLIAPANSPQTIGGLSPNTAYDVYVRNNCTAGSNGFSTNAVASFTTIPPPPPNDLICNAILLQVDGAGDCQNTAGATSSGDPGGISSCSTPNNTVWYKFTPSTNGQKLITMTNPASGNALSAWVFMYTVTGGCSTPTFTGVPFPNSCQAGSNGINGNTTTFLTGALTAGTEYYIIIDGNSGDIGQYCISMSTPPPPPSCATLIAPANGTANLDIYPTAPTFSWGAVAGATSYKLYLGSSAATATPIMSSITDTFAQVTSLAFNTTYYWYIVPVGVGGDAVGCNTNAFSFTTEVTPPSPPNDSCAYAISIPVYNGFAVNATTGTTAFSTTEAGFGTPSCAGGLSNDVWYTFTVPASGNVIIQTSAMNTTVADMVLQVYSGSCGALTELACDDDGNPEGFPSAFHSRISLTGQTPGAVLYARVLPYSSSHYGDFAISAWDPSALPPVSPGGNCIAGTAISINATNGNLYRWVPVFDGAGNIIAELYPNGNALGIVNTSLFVNTGAVRQSNGVYYLDRNVTITPTVQPSSSVKVRTYFLNSELTALQAVDPTVTLGNLNFNKNNDPCQSSVSGATSQFSQTYSATYGATGSLAEFNTPSFSSIYLLGGSIPLPVVLHSFTGKNDGAVNRLSWRTTEEKNFSHFELLRSSTGTDFKPIAHINSSKDGVYAYNDEQPLQGRNFYRLSIVDIDGRAVFSNVVELMVKNTGTVSLALYPNPVKQQLNVEVKGTVNGKGTVSVIDILGKVVQSADLDGNAVMLDMSKLASGTYVIKYNDDTNSFVTKVTKE